jgi:tight adherence protein B
MNTTIDAATLGLIANMLLPLAGAATCVQLALDDGLRRRARTYYVELDRELRHQQSPVLAGQVVLFQIGLAVALFVLALGFATPWPLSLLPAALIGPKFRLERLRRTRIARIDDQLDGWLLTLANGLRANPSLGEAIESSAPMVPEPLRQELSLTIRETKLGMPLDRALRQMVQRVRSPVVSAAVATLNIARSSGGELSKTLETAAASLREMARLEGVVRTKTAEGRAQSVLVGVIPGPLLWLLQSVNPHLFDPLWSTPRGHVLVGIAVLLWASALLWARRIVAVDV